MGKLEYSVEEPLNREPPAPLLVEKFITPVKVAYDRNHGYVPVPLFMNGLEILVKWRGVGEGGVNDRWTIGGVGDYGTRCTWSGCGLEQLWRFGRGSGMFLTVLRRILTKLGNQAIATPGYRETPGESGWSGQRDSGIVSHTVEGGV